MHKKIESFPAIILHCDKADAIPMDEEDWKVLRAINTNARAPAHEIAQATGLTERIVRYRRQEMENKGVIVASMLAIDYRKLDYLFFKCLVSFRSLNEERYQEMRAWLRYHPNVIYWIKVIGPWDAEVEIEVPSVGEFYKMINEFKERFSNIIARIDSVLIATEHAIAHA